MNNINFTEPEAYRLVDLEVYKLVDSKLKKNPNKYADSLLKDAKTGKSNEDKKDLPRKVLRALISWELNQNPKATGDLTIRKLQLSEDFIPAFKIHFNKIVKEFKILRNQEEFYELASDEFKKAASKGESINDTAAKAKSIANSLGIRSYEQAVFIDCLKTALDLAKKEVELRQTLNLTTEQFDAFVLSEIQRNETAERMATKMAIPDDKKEAFVEMLKMKMFKIENDEKNSKNVESLTSHENALIKIFESMYSEEFPDKPKNHLRITSLVKKLPSFEKTKKKIGLITDEDTDKLAVLYLQAAEAYKEQAKTDLSRSLDKLKISEKQKESKSVVEYRKYIESALKSIKDMKFHDTLKLADYLMKDFVDQIPDLPSESSKFTLLQQIADPHFHFSG